jgi:DNA-binding response OmpR family regulator
MSPTPESKGHVLVVDDDRALRHALGALLTKAGHTVRQEGDGPSAVLALADGPDVMLLDVGLPGMSGLEVLSRARSVERPPRVIIMTSDETPATMLQAIRGQADRFVVKPFAPGAIVEIVEEVLASGAGAAALPIEVVSARPEWVELVAPCVLEMADRIQSFVMQLETNLPEPVRESVAQAFREMLTNAIEWGGKLDPQRKVRISCVRAKRLLIYRIADPGEGFNIDKLRHAAISNPKDSPLEHAMVREQQGLRPGGLGLMMTRSLVDELIYNEARNEVVLIKYLD